TDLELPYRSYRLVFTDGSPVERVDKHPFCMSVVHYDAKEAKQQVWAEMSDGAAAWRQSADGLIVMGLKVPKELVSKSDLDVNIQMRYIRVSNRRSGEVYLEGQLHREVIPEECVWEHCGGIRDDGFMLHLKKMNLELLQRWWQHSEMWWKRLFEHHAEIVWDDYDKDYSDLPDEILKRHRASDHAGDCDRMIEQQEKKDKEIREERNEVRRRRRQERLHTLRGGQHTDWVVLDRRNPKREDMPAVPGSRDSSGI
ncbi:hypothetical protein CYMTET_31684, partial [Cymbomonas tetramitiformis]